jgi:hypothetical protein
LIIKTARELFIDQLYGAMIIKTEYKKSNEIVKTVRKNNILWSESEQANDYSP